MSWFVLDTDLLTLYREGHPLVCRRVASHTPDELAITVISVEEQLSGWYRLLRRAKQPKQLARVYQQLADTTEFLSGWRILSFTESAIARHDQLRTRKLNIGTMDLRIAAIVLENKATLASRNLRDFKRVPHLVVENWAE